MLPAPMSPICMVVSMKEPLPRARRGRRDRGHDWLKKPFSMSSARLLRADLHVARGEHEDLAGDPLHAAVQRVREAAGEVDEALGELGVGALEVQHDRDRLLELVGDLLGVVEGLRDDEVHADVAVAGARRRAAGRVVGRRAARGSSSGKMSSKSSRRGLRGARRRTFGRSRYMSSISASGSGGAAGRSRARWRSRLRAARAPRRTRRRTRAPRRGRSTRARDASCPGTPWSLERLDLAAVSPASSVRTASCRCARASPLPRRRPRSPASCPSTARAGRGARRARAARRTSAGCPAGRRRAAASS